MRRRIKGFDDVSPKHPFRKMKQYVAGKLHIFEPSEDMSAEEVFRAHKVWSRRFPQEKKSEKYEKIYKNWDRAFSDALSRNNELEKQGKTYDEINSDPEYIRLCDIATKLRRVLDRIKK